MKSMILGQKISCYELGNKGLMHKQTSEIPGILFPRLFPISLGSSSWAWWAKHAAYQLMFIFHGRLITPFLEGFMSVCLKILICHFVYRFMCLLVDHRLLKLEVSHFASVHFQSETSRERGSFFYGSRR